MTIKIQAKDTKVHFPFTVQKEKTFRKDLLIPPSPQVLIKYMFIRALVEKNSTEINNNQKKQARTADKKQTTKLSQYDE